MTDLRRSRGRWIDAAAVAVAAVAIAGFLVAWRAWWRRPRLSEDKGLLATEYADPAFTRPLGPPSLARTIDVEATGPRFLEWHGSIFVPRDGALILRADVAGAGRAELRLDNLGPEVSADGAPPRGTERRWFVGAGAHRLQVRYALPSGPGAMRLLWLPPGRRGSDTEEYVPSSALGPRPPTEYRNADAVASHPSTFVPAGMVATGILEVLLGLGLFLGRRRLAAYAARLRSNRAARRDLLAFLAVVAAAWAIRLWGLMAQGQTWDEDVYWSAGRNYLYNLVALDFRTRWWLANFEHPPWTKFLAGYMALFHDGYGPARALSALLGALTCGVVYFAGRDLYDRTVGLIAAAVAALLPPLIAHSKVVGHESPTTLFFTLAVWRFLGAVREEHWRGYAAAGVWSGLAIGTRFSSGLVFALLGILAVAHAVRMPTRSAAAKALARAAITPAAAIAFVFVTWPWLWLAPVAHLRSSLQRLFRPHDAELFLGHTVGGAAGAPWSYFPVYFSATVPALILVGLALFLVRTAVRRGQSELVTLLWLLVPFGVAFSPVVQDGVRYLLPAFPAAAIAAAAGATWLAARLWRQRPVLAAATAGALLIADAGVACARIHPYYLDYYNELWGGPARAERERLFEVGWWGEGIGEAVDWMNARAPWRARVWVRLVPSHLTWLRHDLVRVDGPAGADYVLWNQLANGAPPLAGFHEAFTVSADGAPLVRVYRRN